MTGERWIVPPVELQRVAVLSIDEVMKGQRTRPRLSGVLPIDRAEGLVGMHEVVRVTLPELFNPGRAAFAADVLELVEKRLPRPVSAFDEDEMWEPEGEEIEA